MTSSWHPVPTSSSSSRPPWLKGLDKAVTPEALPGDWSPEGTLDAKTRAVGDQTELLVNVGGLVVSLPPEAEVARGERQPLLVLADNRGEAEKNLTVAVQVNSPGGGVPSYTVPVRPGGATAVLAPVQVLRSGEGWARFTFTVGKESASAPVRLHVKAAYPALGQSLSAATPPLPFAQFFLGEAAEARRVVIAAGDPLAQVERQVQGGKLALLQVAVVEGEPVAVGGTDGRRLPVDRRARSSLSPRRRAGLAVVAGDAGRRRPASLAGDAGGPPGGAGQVGAERGGRAGRSADLRCGGRAGGRAAATVGQRLLAEPGAPV